MNFALMFALALGIDYALFIVIRFRGALFGSQARPASRRSPMTMDTAGKAVLFSGADRADLALGGDARAEPRLPLDGARDHARRRLRARRDADAAARGARQARPEGRRARAALGALRRAPLAALRPLGRAALAPPASSTAPARSLILVAARAAGLRAEDRHAVDQGRARPATARAVGYTQVQQAFGAGRPGALQIVAPQREAAAVAAVARRDPGIARVLAAAARRATALALIAGDPERTTPRAAPSARRSTGSAPTLPAGALVGGAAAENHDLEAGARGEDAARDRRRPRRSASCCCWSPSRRR